MEREININIEGYNVNGICVGCLNYNRKMYYCSQVAECFKLLGNIEISEGLAVQVCWECLASIKAVNRFQQQIIRCYDILIDYSRQNTFLNSPKDLSMYAIEHLSISQVLEDCIDSPHVEESDPNIEMDVSVVKNEFDDDELKTENNCVDQVMTEESYTKIQLEDDFQSQDDGQSQDQDDFQSQDQDYFQSQCQNDLQYQEDFPSQDQDVTSEDDIQLSKLKKKKKEKKSKKKRNGYKRREIKEPTILELRRHRKLKNLPEDLVELYIMTEEEMWQIRREDVENKEFTKLRYRCDDCILEFNTEKLMNDHMSGKHKPKNGHCKQCDVCKAYMLTKDKLSIHRSLHLTAYRCKECGISTTLKRIMLKHSRVHKDCFSEEFKCITCEKSFSTKSKLAYHRGTCDQEKPQCDCCGKVFASKMTLRYHLNLKNMPKDERPKEKLYIPCKGCNKIFTSKKSYRAHVVIHDGLSYPCPVCGKMFQWKRNLARHMRNHKERDAGTLHECRECGKSFSSRDCYNNHMRLSKRHVAEDAYVHECNYCGKKFATKWCMVDHIDWEHLELKKYQCSVCFKPFKTAKIMVAHMNNIHEGRKNREPEGEHLCEVCGKSYKTVKRLKGHVWAMHTNRSTSKSFKCKLCPATFTWQTSIYKHMKMMHENTKRKIPRTHQSKKTEQYPEMEITNRMHYLVQQQNIIQQQNMVHNMVQNVPSSGLVQNIV